MNTFMFYRLGADPEYLYVTQTPEGRYRVQPAVEINRASRNSGLSSFIGNDGHPATGELRPPPARNIFKLLFYMGFALQKIEEVCNRLYPDVKIMAAPFIGGEPLGGHIHVSYLYPCGQAVPISAESFSGIVSTLLRPFEIAIQPESSRLTRMQNYGRNDADVRVSIRTHTSETALIKYEYRTPSTWLISPYLAYSYLALTKLVALNILTLQTYHQSIRNAQWCDLVDTIGLIKAKKQAIFLDIYNRVQAMCPLKSKDLNMLNSAIKTCFDNRTRWFKTPSVRFEEWKQFTLEDNNTNQ